MTMRTIRHFVYPNGHEGHEATSENDQPYCTPWESVTSKGMTDAGKDSRGYAAYICQLCGQPVKSKIEK